MVASLCSRSLIASRIFRQLVGIGFRRFESTGLLLPQPFATSPTAATTAAATAAIATAATPAAAAAAGNGGSCGEALPQQPEQPLLSRCWRPYCVSCSGWQQQQGPTTISWSFPLHCCLCCCCCSHDGEPLLGSDQTPQENLPDLPYPQRLQQQLKSLQGRMQLATGEAPRFSGHARQLEQKQQLQQKQQRGEPQQRGKTTSSGGASAAAAPVGPALSVEEGGVPDYMLKASLEGSVRREPEQCGSDEQGLPAAAAASAATAVALAAHTEEGPVLAVCARKGEDRENLRRGPLRDCHKETVPARQVPQQQQPLQQQRRQEQQQQGTRRASAHGACKHQNIKRTQSRAQQAAAARGLQLVQQQHQRQPQQQQRLRQAASTEGGYPRCCPAAVPTLSGERVLRQDGSPPLLLTEQQQQQQPQQQQQQRQQHQQQEPSYLYIGSMWQLGSDASSPEESRPGDAHEAHWRGFLLRFRLAAEQQQQQQQLQRQQHPQQRQGHQQQQQQQPQQHWPHRQHQRHENNGRQWQPQQRQQQAQQQRSETISICCSSRTTITLITTTKVQFHLLAIAALRCSPPRLRAAAATAGPPASTAADAVEWVSKAKTKAAATAALLTACVSWKGMRRLA
ncbi:hypothetical protein ACSSS7_004243 [Eimeria intestinalis]